MSRFPHAGMRRLAALMALVIAQAHAQPAPPAVPTRGELLYKTHCIECHTEQMHWRALRQARDWDSLKAQVTRWQGTARLGWSDDDITEVARHLNETIYRFALPQQKAGR